MRRPFTFDLVYPIPELKPYIGKVKPVLKEMSQSISKQLHPKSKKEKEKQPVNRFKNTGDKEVTSDTEALETTELKRASIISRTTPVSSQSQKARSKSVVPAKPKLLLKAPKNDIMLVYSSVSRASFSSKEDKRKNSEPHSKTKITAPVQRP